MLKKILTSIQQLQQQFPRDPSLIDDELKAKATLVGVIDSGAGFAIHSCASLKARKADGMNKGFKTYVGKLEEKFHADNKYLNYVNYAVSFRRALDLQINAFCNALENNDPTLYKPVQIR